MLAVGLINTLCGWAAVVGGEVAVRVVQIRVNLLPQLCQYPGLRLQQGVQSCRSQKTLHLEDEFGLVFQLHLQLSDLSLKLQRVFRNTVLIIDLQAFQTDLKTERKRVNQNISFY